MPSRVFHSLEEGIVSGSGSFYVARFGVLFPVFLNLKVRNYSEYPFVILVPGTTRRGNPLPIFQRSSYSESIHGNVLVLADPTLNFDENMLITACLLCNCKKVDNFTDLNKIRTYAKDGADYLATLGFDKRFCKICEQVNRYTGSEPREPEADILELIDQFGGMLLDRPERIGFKVDEALVLLEYRNLKGKQNRYLEIFKDFVNRMEAIKVWA